MGRSAGRSAGRTPRPDTVYSTEATDEGDYVTEDGTTLAPNGLDYPYVSPGRPALTARNMRAHRAALLREQEERDAKAAAEAAARDERAAADLAREMQHALELADTAARLAAAEEQLRSLQATLVAERMKTTAHERRAAEERERRERYRAELALAVSVLRRAKDDGKRSEKERRRLQRAFEEARVR